jgi:hypothetical protein
MWISQFFSTTSKVYVVCKDRDKACVRRGPKLDKKERSRVRAGFAHSFLWICMGLSTHAVARVDPCCPFGMPAWVRYRAQSVCQVYTQKLVYRIVVMVNGAVHLWISALLSTASMTYETDKQVGRRCMFLVEKLDKF